MRFFRRNKQEDVSSDVQGYYQTEKSGRRGIAWLLALATVITTLVLTLGLFYGGRWAYRSIFGSDEKDNKSNPIVNQPTNDEDHGAPAQTTSPAPSATTPNTSQTSNSSSSVSPTSTPTTGPLPNTGPDLPL